MQGKHSREQLHSTNQAAHSFLQQGGSATHNHTAARRCANGQQHDVAAASSYSSAPIQWQTATPPALALALVKAELRFDPKDEQKLL
eukprot:6491534-Amphidinium_carterae.1